MKVPFHPQGGSRRISQLQTNGCRWLGDFREETAEHMAGQTFQINQSGQLETISVYCEMVHRQGKVRMSLHRFDEEEHNWGPALGIQEMEIPKGSDPTWVDFNLGQVSLDGNSRYGFRLQTQDALIALGEAVWGNDKNDWTGEEWIAKGNEKGGHYFRYFSLVYSVGMN